MHSHGGTDQSLGEFHVGMTVIFHVKIRKSV